VKLQIKTDGRQFQAQEDELQTNVDGQQISDEGLDNEEEVMDVTEVSVSVYQQKPAIIWNKTPKVKRWWCSSVSEMGGEGGVGVV